MTRRISLVLRLVGATALAACGDTYVDLSAPISSDSAPVGIDAGVGVGTVGGVRAPCPADRPRENSACVVGDVCEYGRSADMTCNTTMICASVGTTGAWEARLPEGCHDVCPANADVASLDGKPCALDADGSAVTDADEAVCNTSDGICACTTGPDRASAHPRRWVCVRPNSVCPRQRPPIGQRCDGALWCNYGSCAFKRGMVVECKDGVWVQGGATCH